MTLGSRSSPAITSAGSPGNNCCSEKIRIDTKNSVGISCRIRLPRKFSMARTQLDAQGYQLRSKTTAASFPPSLDGSLELQPDHAHQPVRHLLVAVELGGMRDQDSAMVDVQERLLLHRSFRQLLVDRLALRHVGDEPRIVERLVGPGIAPCAVILRSVGVKENVGIAVGIDSSTPCQHEGLVFA